MDVDARPEADSAVNGPARSGWDGAPGGRRYGVRVAERQSETSEGVGLHD